MIVAVVVGYSMVRQYWIVARVPQVFVQGELVGGSDIVLEMLQDGSLKEMFDAGRDA